MKRLLLGAVFGLIGFASEASAASAPPTQCVTNALASGTANALTIPLIPCGLTTNILILTLAHANTGAATLQMAGYPALPILTNTGQAITAGTLPGAGDVVIITGTGSSWLLLNNAATDFVSPTFSGTVTFPDATTWTSTTLTPGTALNALFHAPPALGSVTPGSGAFTTLSATSTVSGAGFTTYLASPPAIGGSSPAAGTFTTVTGTTLATTGSSSGTVSIKSSTGTFNFNLPTTAGTSGQVLASGGGGAAAMTWVSPTVSSGTAGQFAYYASTGSTISGSGNLTISGSDLTIGVAGSAAGTLALTGSSTGTITLKGTGVSIGTYNWNFPTTAGTSGQPMISGGGGSSAMSWGTVTGTTTLFPTFSGSTVNGDCVSMNALGNLIDNGSPCGSGGSGTVTASTAGQLAYYASSTNAVAGNVNVNISSGALTLGVANTTQGSLVLDGSTSGAVSLKPQAAAGTWNFNFPTTAGSAGQVLTSQGGGSTAMTWAAAGVAWGTAQTTSFTAAVNTSYCIDTLTTGAVTGTLPASPSDGDVVQFTDCKSNFATTAFTVARNGNNIMGLASNMDVTTNSASFTLRYWSSTTDWRLQ